ncbi:myb-related transcription factor, partner of profilin-like [Ictalurus furcatus]|uniref:myb-related transcription factor, partner of profilin-like n=1 Tax=Ictalurus furcatus TaxID=66913 RepID=UPI002350E36B|nr:myb-related transcription factor, partner of profilin-like [Ictalurus furcatus]
MSGCMDEIRDRLRQKKFTQEETDILVREVQNRHDKIYGTRNRPPRSEDVKKAWDEVAKTVNATSSTGIRRTAMQCRKRFNDVRRRTKQKITASRRAMNGAGGGGRGGGGGGGASTSETLSPAEDTTFPEESAHGFGGLEFGLTAPQGDAAVLAPKSEPVWDEMERAEAEAEIEVEVEDSVQPTGRRRHGQQRPGDLAFLDVQQGGFDMLQRELGALRRTMNTRLRRMESRVYPLLASVEDSLRRLANAAERWAPPLSDTGSASASAQPTNPRHCLRVRTRGRRGGSINIWL